MHVRLVLTDGTVVTANVPGLDAIPAAGLVGKDERGIDTFVNPRYIVRAYSIDDSPVLPAAGGSA